MRSDIKKNAARLFGEKCAGGNLAAYGQPDEHSAIRWLGGNYPLAALATGIPNAIYGHTVALPALGRGDASAFNAVLNHAKSLGINVTTGDDLAAAIEKGVAATPNSFLQGAQANAARTARSSPAFYHPGTGFLGKMFGAKAPIISYLPDAVKNPATIAHEIGHHLNPKWLTRLQMLGKPAGIVGTLGALASKDERTSRNFALGGTAAAVPTLVSEFEASRRGAALMKSLKLPGRWGAFIGLPTYAIAASTPLVAHYSKKYMGGFTPPPTFMQKLLQNKYLLPAAGIGAAATGAGALGYMLSRRRNNTGEEEEKSLQESPPALRKAASISPYDLSKIFAGLIDTTGAARFPVDQTALRQALISAGVGGTLGGLKGYFYPGYEEKLDDEGRVLSKKKIKPWVGALQQAGIGAGTGALANYAGQVVARYNPEIDRFLFGKSS